MKKIQIIAVGKLREPNLRAACDEYLKRCQHRFQVSDVEVRDLRALENQLPRDSTIIVLDEKGEMLTSRAFAQRLDRFLSAKTSSVCIVIGGADGLNDAIRSRASLLLSFGPMTFPHRLIRVILCEQIYRALSILDGSPYHRG